MGPNADSRSNLKLIRGGLYRSVFYGALRIVAAPVDSPPFDVEAITFEEDTWLIMSADPESCEIEKNPIRLMTELIEAITEKHDVDLAQAGARLALRHPDHEDARLVVRRAGPNQVGVALFPGGGDIPDPEAVFFTGGGLRRRVGAYRVGAARLGPRRGLCDPGA